MAAIHVHDNAITVNCASNVKIMQWSTTEEECDWDGGGDCCGYLKLKSLWIRQTIHSYWRKTQKYGDPNYSGNNFSNVLFFHVIVSRFKKSFLIIFSWFCNGAKEKLQKSPKFRLGWRRFLQQNYNLVWKRMEAILVMLMLLPICNRRRMCIRS